MNSTKEYQIDVEKTDLMNSVRLGDPDYFAICNGIRFLTKEDEAEATRRLREAGKIYNKACDEYENSEVRKQFKIADRAGVSTILINGVTVWDHKPITDENQKAHILKLRTLMLESDAYKKYEEAGRVHWEKYTHFTDGLNYKSVHDFCYKHLLKEGMSPEDLAKAIDEESKMGYRSALITAHEIMVGAELDKIIARVFESGISYGVEHSDSFVPRSKSNRKDD